MNMGDEYPYLYNNSNDTDSEEVMLIRYPHSTGMAKLYHSTRSHELIESLPSNNSTSTYARCDQLRDILLDRLEDYEYRDNPDLVRSYIHDRLPTECFTHNLTKEANRWMAKAEIPDHKILLDD